MGAGSPTVRLAKESTSQVLCGAWTVPARGGRQTVLKILLLMMKGQAPEQGKTLARKVRAFER